jgi:hypothetical protein
MPEASQPVARPSFLHFAVKFGVLESLCCACGKEIAFAPDERYLSIADLAHVCAPADQKTGGDAAAD